MGAVAENLDIAVMTVLNLGLITMIMKDVASEEVFAVVDGVKGGWVEMIVTISGTGTGVLRAGLDEVGLEVLLVDLEVGET